ncbi:MAG TPA: DUF4129 domain-containing protein [Mycobacteriales bacterium]|nr:DUF4129 domain-containing protein [Mycobacteriales bacterium]
MLSTAPLAAVVRTATQAAEELTRGGAREAARDELAKPEYQVGRPSLLDRLVAWVSEKLADLFLGALSVVPGGVVGLVLIVIGVVLLAVLLRLGLGPVGLRDALSDRRRGARSMTAADYRAEADRLVAEGAWKEAVRARFRALVRELEERGVIDPHPGRTAGEIAGEAARGVPSVSAAVRSAAGMFDAVWYGGRAAGAAEHEVVHSADRAVREARLTVGATT